MNTRNSYGRYSTRYNNTGTFVPAVTTNIQPVQTTYSQQNKTQQSPQQQQQWNQDTADTSYTMQQAQQPADTYIKTDQSDDGNDMSMEALEDIGDENGGGKRMKWMKKGFKLSMRERRRRQNKQLRKLLTPKNALTVLNELTPGTQHECSVVQEQDQYGGNLNKQYVAVLNVAGIEYRGTGISKLLAKNNAAEQVIRDVMIKQMASLPSLTSPTEEKVEPMIETESVESPEKPFFPMMQLASYALHKLFSDWQQEGFKVPNLGPAKVTTNISDKESESSVTTQQPAKKVRKVPVLPSNAVHLHPCMLLSQMKNDATYSFLSVEGIKPNSQIFTMGVNVEGTTYVGKAQNKKEARRLAAKKACETLFNVVYPDDGKVSIEDM